MHMLQVELKAHEDKRRLDSKAAPSASIVLSPPTPRPTTPSSLAAPSYPTRSPSLKTPVTSTRPVPSSVISTPSMPPPSSTPAGGEKRIPKPYGRTESGSPSRSRSATHELELPPDDSTMGPPEFAVKLVDVKIKDGEALLLKCSVKGDPLPSVEWFRNGEVVSSSDIIDLKYKKGVATLSINEVFPEDEGEYMCKATNSIGKAQTKCRLVVEPMDSATAAAKGKSADKPPRITEHIKSAIVTDGDPVTLQCRIIGTAKFDVVWLHNEKEIKPSKDFQYVTEGDIYKLLITEIFPEDGGTYTCEAFNDGGEAFSSCTLIVHVPVEELKSPKFTTFPDSLTIPEGKTAVFTVEGEKELKKVVWLKDGKPIDTSSARHKITAESKTRHTLEIPNSLVTDVGQYSVKAESKKVEGTVVFSLNVFTQDDV